MNNLTPTDLITAMRTYLRERSRVVGYATALHEVEEAVLQVEMYGTADILNAQPRRANKPMTSQPLAR